MDSLIAWYEWVHWYLFSKLWDCVEKLNALLQNTNVSDTRSDLNKANSKESSEKPGSNGKRRIRERCGWERKGCRLTRFALSRRWRFYSWEFTALRSQRFLRSEVISEFSRQASLFSLFPASSRNATQRGRCKSRKRKQTAIPFITTSCILRVPLYHENKQKQNKCIRIFEFFIRNTCRIVYKC